MPSAGLSCAVRQWAADSHCALLHGDTLGFRFTFAAEQLDVRGWVVDFGSDGFRAHSGVAARRL
ncbi:6-carboxytetrahydropterin synthase [Phenylobacterium sp.]|uniref:6-carboxytetrahydropterin synthase n=1 Tax=Phenylobacterium sp. TaxID=1871053 RepID=UPI002FDB92FA